MTRVAILGWGSLLWNPGTLRSERRWRSDGPWLPVEFARISNLKEKNGRPPYLSLVIFPHAGLVRTYWDVSLVGEIAEACLDLKSREGCGIEHIAYLTRDDAAWSSTTPGLGERIRDWLDRKKNDVDAVIWTNLAWKLPGVATFTVEEGMRWLRVLREAKKDNAAEEYIRRAPPQTDTCLRRQAKEEFGWSDIPMDESH